MGPKGAPEGLEVKDHRLGQINSWLYQVKELQGLDWWQNILYPHPMWSDEGTTWGVDREGLMPGILYCQRGSWGPWGVRRLYINFLAQSLHIPECWPFLRKMSDFRKTTSKIWVDLFGLLCMPFNNCIKISVTLISKTILKPIRKQGEEVQLPTPLNV